MPELPEVETVVGAIRPLIVGKTIADVSRPAKHAVVHQPLSYSQFEAAVVGQTILRIWRRGKYIIWDLDSGYVIAHLRMTGRFISHLTSGDKPAHITAAFRFTDGSTLYFKDYRKFGRITWAADLDSLEARLGPEPLGKTFTPGFLFTGLCQRSRQIKSLLLDQSFIAGIGNIYADEALWAARIHPETRSGEISRIKSNRLHRVIVTILSEAIKAQGTTIINFYFGEGSRGNYRESLQVFDRDKQACPRCQSSIKKIRVGQRGTHFCPRCQKK